MSKVLDHMIYGDDMQAVEITLNPGEVVRAEAGTMLYREPGVKMETKADGGIMKGLGRIITGESFFIPRFTNETESDKKVSFAAPYPGKLIPIELSETGSFYCQRDSFICADINVEVEVAFTKKLGAGFFGGEGFILQRLSGVGQAFIHAGGTIIEKDLQEGEKLLVDTGCLVAFATTVDYNIEFVGGIRNTLFGGEGLFLTTLTGPGKVYLQSLPFSRMAKKIVTASGMNKGESTGAAGIGGSIMKSVISGN